MSEKNYNIKIEAFKSLLGEIKLKEKINDKQLASKVLVTKGYLSNLLNGKKPLTNPFLQKLFTAFPKYEPDNAYELFIESETISEPETSFKGGTASQHVSKLLPVYDLQDSTTPATLFSHEGTKSHETISFLGSDQCDFAIRNYSNAMTGKVDNGGALGVKEIFDKEIIPYGHVYVIITDDLVMCRYIYPSEQRDSVLLVSHNKLEYGSFDVKRTKIKRLFIVKKIQNSDF